MQTTVREEQILNKTATFAPKTKDEIFLSNYAKGGGDDGGGGDSDLSFFNVTLIAPEREGSSILILAPFYNEDEGSIDVVPFVELYPGDTYLLKIIAPKDSVAVLYSETSIRDVPENVEYVGGYSMYNIDFKYYYISGDCTIQY